MKSIDHGILLKKINYSETSLILHFFTLEKGFQAYLFQGGKKKKGNILQPLSIVEINAYQRPDSELGKISSISPDFIPQSIPYHPLKSGLAFFMTEVLEQALRSSDEDARMYNMIDQEIQWLDDTDAITNYPIWFLLRLADQLGFAIQKLEKDGRIFDLQAGTISNQTPDGHAFENDDAVIELRDLLSYTKTELLAQSIHKIHRQQIVEHLISYYRWHIEGFKHPKSLHVMQTIFN
jgi:DNA repair protein RecO (recombination protein O)